MSACSNEGSAFVQCRAMDTSGKCALCPPVNFDNVQETFKADLQQTFMMQMAYASPTSPEFCQNVEINVCGAFPEDACCCAEEISAWQQCLIQKEFSLAVNQAEPCMFDCLPKGGKGGGGGGGSNGIVIAIVMLVLIAGGGLGGYLFMRKRRAAQNGKNVDDSDDDTFKDESNDNDKSKKGGFFGMFGMGSNTPPTSDTEDDKKKKKKKQKKPRGFDEESQIISDVSPSDGESTCDRRGSRKGKKRYDEDDSITNDYGSNSKYGKLSSPKGPREVYRGNPGFDDDSISEMGMSQDHRRREEEKSRSRKASDLPDKIASSRKISSRELKEIMRSKEESAHEMEFMKKSMRDIEDRLSKRDREADNLRRDREDQDRRIRELEAKNARLQQKAMEQSSNSSTGGNSNSYRDQSGRSKASVQSQGQPSRSKASMADDGSSSRKQRRSESRQRSRSASGRSLGRSSSGRDLGSRPSNSRDMSERSGSNRDLGSRPSNGRDMSERSGSNRDLRRQGSNRSIGRERRTRSPSSSRGLGKQSSSMRRTASRERIEREPPREYSADRMRRSSSRSRLDRERSQRRSKSPRSYLREDQ